LEQKYYQMTFFFLLKLKVFMMPIYTNLEFDDFLSSSKRFHLNA
jgi:hypothetical protein